MRLHIGSGALPREGWTNIDIQPLEGVDHVLDVRQGLPFFGVEYVFAEHFIEHLTLVEALAFLRECRRILEPAGVVRLSTPNLDWVWLTHYRNPSDMRSSEAVQGCLEINRAFHGWGHRFLWNGETLDRALRAAGFARIVSCRYGESEHGALRGLEQHEQHQDRPLAPSLVIREASGTTDPERGFEQQIAPYVRDEEYR